MGKQVPEADHQPPSLERAEIFSTLSRSLQALSGTLKITEAPKTTAWAKALGALGKATIPCRMEQCKCFVVAT